MLVILSGQTAVGKTVVEKELKKLGWVRAISYSTRPKRSNEEDGVDYIFINNKTFDQLYSNKSLYERTDYTVNGERWQYGLGPESFTDGKVNVVTVNPHGLKQLVENEKLRKEIVVFHMQAPLEVRKKRYLERETSPDKEKNLEQRIKRDQKDFVEKDGVNRSGAKTIVDIHNYNRSIKDTAKEIFNIVEEMKRG